MERINPLAVKSILSLGEQSLEIMSVLARGGQSIVYLANNLETGDKLVVKELAPIGDTFRQSGAALNWTVRKETVFSEWQRNFALQQAIDHDAVYCFEDLCEQNNTLYLVGKYHPGQSLLSHLQDICFDGQMPPMRLVALLLPVIQGLHSIHKMGWVHGDIKPANIYLRHDKQVMLLDGLTDGSCRLDNSEGYSAPEIKEKLQTKASDFYSLGVLIAYLMTGKLFNTDEPVNADVKYGKELLGFVSACLSQVPEKRPEALLPLVDILNRMTAKGAASLPSDVPTVKLLRTDSPNRAKLSLLNLSQAKWRLVTKTAALVGLLLVAVPTAKEWLELQQHTAVVLESTANQTLPVSAVVSPSDEEHNGAVEPELVEEVAMLPLESVVAKNNKLRTLSPVAEPVETATTELSAQEIEVLPKPIEKLLQAMVRVPAGEFWMGSSNGTDAELPVTRTQVAEFDLLSHEVTQELYQLCVKQGSCRRLRNRPQWSLSPNMPVTGVSFLQIQREFLPWLNQQSDVKFRLPSEKEWEYAAKFGIGADYTWGMEASSNQANCRECGNQFGGRRAVQVGSFSASELGLYDMNGNVAEWVGSCWIENHQETDKRLQHCENITVKGGYWDSRLGAITNSARIPQPKQRSSLSIGFRLARSR